MLGLFPNSCCSSILILVKNLTVAHVSSVNLLCLSLCNYYCFGAYTNENSAHHATARLMEGNSYEGILSGTVLLLVCLT